MYERINLELTPCCMTCIDYEPNNDKAKQGICGYRDMRVHMCHHCDCYSENQERIHRIEANLMSQPPYRGKDE
ncbi:hypothetical protein G166_gp32 [Clostridium phage phi8074-B1]|uniref:hypothetical protein n=1 Tax=Clostridium phage phi8074-B1 TaxID=1147137 RepID=UPI00025C0C53|nr:hypothetical protein G166_gp32 [Clostridium phage phi8074-B1]AFC61964.1 hypothetical protein phi8074-B1_00032 [Clostridium phage phi8074-B1]